jgi:proline utilization trans-activator
MAIDDRQIRAELPRPFAGFQSPLPLNINIRIARVTGEIMTCRNRPLKDDRPKAY